MPHLPPVNGALSHLFLFQDHFKSAFFYFEGVFYNDMRFPECVDISRSVLSFEFEFESKIDRALIQVQK